MVFGDLRILMQGHDTIPQATPNLLMTNRPPMVCNGTCTIINRWDAFISTTRRAGTSPKNRRSRGRLLNWVDNSWGASLGRHSMVQQMVHPPMGQGFEKSGNGRQQGGNQEGQTVMAYRMSWSCAALERVNKRYNNSGQIF